MSKQSDLVNITQGDTLYVDHTSGNVGIGTSSPAARLHLVNSQGGAIGRVLIDANVSSGYDAKITATDVGLEFTSQSNGRGFAFSTGSTPTERMRIDSSGRLLVGTTNEIANAKLNIQISDIGMAVKALNNGNWAAGFYNTSGGNVGQIVINAASTSYNTSSDYRLKTDAQPMTGASDRVLALNPVNFAWKVDGSRVDGFLAHEAQAVVPEAVTGSKDAMRTQDVYDEDGNVTGTEEVPDYQGIDQSKLVPLLTAALQEALTEIADLKARVTALETV